MFEKTDIEQSFNRFATNARGAYEKVRWGNSVERELDYSMTQKSLQRLARNVVFSHFLELGPGPGTWTKMFIASVPNASFDLVDISEAMLKEARAELRDVEHIRYIRSDFMSFMANRKYDFFFSSRAIEYLPSKKDFAGKISSLMETGGQGVIITKMPHYKRSILAGKTIPPLHRGQIKPKILTGFLKDAGFSVSGVWPVTLHTPGISIPFLNGLLYRLFSSFRLNCVSAFFSESYAVTFTKP